jgi:hypothetical protein
MSDPLGDAVRRQRRLMLVERAIAFVMGLTFLAIAIVGLKFNNTIVNWMFEVLR